MSKMKYTKPVWQRDTIDRAPLLKEPLYASISHLVGKDPRSVGAEGLMDAGIEPVSPLKAIRARCVACCDGSEYEARLCTIVDCPLWPFRTGKNPFRAPATEAQKAHRHRLPKFIRKARPKKAQPDFDAVPPPVTRNLAALAAAPLSRPTAPARGETEQRIYVPNLKRIG